jgi:hypothetical protein
VLLGQHREQVLRLDLRMIHLLGELLRSEQRFLRLLGELFRFIVQFF